MRYEKLNIEITNEQYFDKIEELGNYIELYSNNILKFEVYPNSRIDAYDSSKVGAFDCSRIRAYDNSTVYAKDSSKVRAYDKSIIHAYNGSTIDVWNSATVYACDSSKVIACDSSIIYTYNSSTVYAKDNSTVHAKDNSTIYAHGSSTVYAKDSSILYAHNSSTVYAEDRSTLYAKDKSTVHAYSSSIVYAYDSSIVYAYEFTCIYIKSHKVTINAISHFGAIIKQVFELKEDMFVYKKLRGAKIATLKLIKGQTFQSKYFDKCRTDRAVVVEISNIENTEKYQTGISAYYDNFIYEVGKEVIADKYDENIDECSNGIHFFLTRKKAENYHL